MNPKLSILIVTWNSWADLNRLMESIRRVGLQEFEVLVIDNGSTDGTAEKLRARFGEQVRLYCNSQNLGLPPAVNIGIRLARGEYVMLLDVDTEIHPDTATHLLEFMTARPDVALAAPRILTPEGHDEGTARNLPSVMNGLFGRQSRLTRRFPHNPFARRYLQIKSYSDREPYQVEQVSAACMFMRRRLLDEVGPWDEAYRCYWVDTDWCARLKALGHQVWCVPRARITHYENNRAGRKKSPWRIWHFHTGALRLYRKHYTLGWLDPRTLCAGMVLMLRAAVLVVVNEIQPARLNHVVDQDRTT